MRGHNSKIAYNLYADGAHQVVWGDGTAGTATVPIPAGAISLGHPLLIPVYGLVYSHQHVELGGFSDSVSAIIE